MRTGDAPTSRERAAMRGAIASIWLATGLLVAHPVYREIGADWLARIGLPAWVMFPACVAEAVLGVLILSRPAAGWLAAAQVGAMGVFTAVLAAADPMLLVHPLGMLTKNLPLAALIGVLWVVERDGWTPGAMRLLRAGMAVIWITEGLLPKVLFQQAWELGVVARTGVVAMDPPTFLALLGAAQAFSGVLAFVLPPGKLLRIVLACQLAALVALPALVSWQDPILWVHPFGPMTKNIPILVGTALVYRRCGSSS